jgi:hypothetical protein
MLLCKMALCDAKRANHKWTVLRYLMPSHMGLTLARAMRDHNRPWGPHVRVLANRANLSLNGPLLVYHLSNIYSSRAYRCSGEPCTPSGLDPVQPEVGSHDLSNDDTGLVCRTAAEGAIGLVAEWAAAGGRHDDRECSLLVNVA